MRGLMKAIARALAAMGRVVWTKCKETGTWIASMVLGSAAVDSYDELEIQEPAPPSLDHVRALAAAVVIGAVRPEMLEQVDEATFEWLSVLDRKMVAKVLMSSDADLRAHIRGQRGIKGVVPADAVAVAEYRRALERKSVQHDAELSYDGPEPAFA